MSAATGSAAMGSMRLRPNFWSGARLNRFFAVPSAGTSAVVMVVPSPDGCPAVSWGMVLSREMWSS